MRAGCLHVERPLECRGGESFRVASNREEPNVVELALERNDVAVVMLYRHPVARPQQPQRVADVGQIDDRREVAEAETVAAEQLLERIALPHEQVERGRVCVDGGLRCGRGT